jgi:cell wall-associated NlpC family hydrolase
MSDIPSSVAPNVSSGTSLTSRLAALESAAASWAGTPFCEHSAVKGAGVCCHLAVIEVYREAGFIAPDVLFPDGPVNWSRTQSRSLMEEAIDGQGREWVVSVAANVSSRMPGDLLGFKVGHCVHHLAIQLPRGRIFHAVDKHGAIIAPNLPPQWAKRLARIWRPLCLVAASRQSAEQMVPVLTNGATH